MRAIHRRALLSKIGTWCGSLLLELLAVVPLMYAMPSLFYQLAHSKLLHVVAPGSILKLKQMQTTYDAQCPPKASKQ